MNVLFVTVDDLRPEIGAFHPWSPNDVVLTPNMDALARRGSIFTSAVVQLALCAPSRTSFLTSLRPDSTAVWSIGPHFRNTTLAGRTAVTLPEAFKIEGWHTESYGKTFHVSPACYQSSPSYGPPAPCLNDPASWSVPAWFPDPYNERGTRATDGKNPTGRLNPNMLSFAAVDAPEEDFPDGNISTHAVAALRRFAAPGGLLSEGRHFFLAVGFLKPHLPHVFPRQYLELYNGVKPPTLAREQAVPVGSPSVAWAQALQEICEYPNVNSSTACSSHTAVAPPAPLPARLQRSQKLAYHAATSFVDAQIGKLLTAVDALRLRESTVVAVVGDHGWKLGEHAGWAKKTNYLFDTRGLLLIASPAQRAPSSLVPALVEYVDIYPTLIDLAMLPESAVRRQVALEGISFSHLLDDAAALHKVNGFHQYPCATTTREELATWHASCMGVGVVSTELQKHYIEWVAFNTTTCRPNFARLHSSELYDLHADLHESINVANKSVWAGEQQQLQRTLRAHFGGSQPRCRPIETLDS